MLFTSISYLVFLFISSLLYYIIPKQHRFAMLLFTSLGFCLFFGWTFFIPLIYCILLSWIGAKQIEKSQENKKRILLLIISVFNLLPLIFTKYLGFFVELLNRFFPVSIGSPSNSFVATIGISFYTFGTLGYLVDVRRGRCKAEQCLNKYLLYILFFPQVASGPIPRTDRLLGQLNQAEDFNFETYRKGVSMIVLGYFEKLWIADRIGLYVDAIYGQWVYAAGRQIFLAALLYGIQIYADFCGYSLIAVGSARLFGIQLEQNFFQPYLADSVHEFWKRWHRSLTRWFRDYVYIPLGGNRCSRFLWALNILLVFGLSGLWHGATLSFLAWGLLNGLLQIAEKQLKTERVIKNRIVRTLLTFLILDFTWIFFRANSLGGALHMIMRMITRFNAPLLATGFTLSNTVVLIFGIVILFSIDLIHETGNEVLDFSNGKPYWVRGIVVLVAMLLIVVFGIWGAGYESQSFIYFHF